jgi:hypothetical protein
VDVVIILENKEKHVKVKKDLRKLNDEINKLKRDVKHINYIINVLSYSGDDIQILSFIDNFTSLCL